MSATVMVVDDDDMVRRLAVRMLTLDGHQVLEAPCGDAALRILQRHGSRVRVVVTDLAMPGMDGRNLGTEISRGWPHVQVLYMSGYPEQRMIQNGALDVGWPFIQKPFTTAQLGGKVRELLTKPPETTEA